MSRVVILHQQLQKLSRFTYYLNLWTSNHFRTSFNILFSMSSKEMLIYMIFSSRYSEQRWRLLVLVVNNFSRRPRHVINLRTKTWSSCLRSDGFYVEPIHAQIFSTTCACFIDITVVMPAAQNDFKSFFEIPVQKSVNTWIEWWIEIPEPRYGTTYFVA